MDASSLTTVGPPTGWSFDEAGMNALLLDLELLTALVFGPVRCVEADRAA